MKKYILLFLLLVFIPVIVLARGQYYKAVTAIASCCNTLTFVGNPGDAESFECSLVDDGCTTEMTVTENDAGTISTYDTTRAVTGSHSASRTITAADQEDNIIQFNYGAADADFTDRFWYWLPDFNDKNGQYFAAWSQTTNIASTFGVNLRHRHNNTGNGRIEVHGTGSPDDTSIDLATNAWYLIEVDYNQDPYAGTVKIYNASSVLQDTLNYTARDQDIQYLTFTNIYSAISTSQTHYYDDVQHKSSGGGF